LLFLLGPHYWEAPYPFCPITYCALAGMGFVVVFSGATIHACRLHDYGHGTLWNGKDYLSDLFYSLFGIGIGRYLPPQIIKELNIICIKKFKRELDNFF
jgi:hypothetical protein